MIIGIDPHKRSHTASVVDPVTNTVGTSLRIEASLAGYRALLKWGRQFVDRRWAIENAKVLGCHLGQWLVARDEPVFDVATTATARVRELSRGGRRNNDVIDAAAAAGVAALQGDAVEVTPDDETTVFALLEERRANVAGQRVRAVNQLHALLRDLIPGGAKTGITAGAATVLLGKVRPASPVERTRKALAQDIVRDFGRLDTALADIASQMTAALNEYGTQLLNVDGVGPVLGVRLIGRTGRASRFPGTDAFASYTGVAPIEVASGEHTRHRLSRSGDRQLNSALHLIAVTQVRTTNSPGRRYFDKKIADGKTRNEAIRCLKRRIASHVWRIMVADEKHRHHTAQRSGRAA
jgi:transposase